MAVALPDWVAEKVGPVSNGDDGSLVVQEYANTDQVKYSELLAAVTVQLFDRIEVVEIERVRDWRYVEVSLGATVVCELVEVPEQWGIGRPASAVENALIQAWLVEEKFDPEGICSRFPDVALLCWRAEVGSAMTVDAVLAAAGLCRREQAVPFELTLRDRTRMRIGAASALMQSSGSGVYARLFQRALSEPHVELRFLYFYRVFERSYLSSAYSRLAADFFSDPRGALSAAEKEVSNERLSFISLVLPSPEVASWFELIEQESFALSSSNQFMGAIRRSCDKDGWFSEREAWRRGCSVCYKIRCAIVHAGERGPIFEEFSDSEAACASLVPYLETAAAALLEIQPA